MAEERLPFIRGRIERADSFQGPTTPVTPRPLPQPDPKVHQQELTRQLDALEATVHARTANDRDQDAVRELVAVRPVDGATLDEARLANKPKDARLVGVVKETGVVVLDVLDPKLEHIRQKVDDFADDANRRTARRRCIAPARRRLLQLSRLRWPLWMTDVDRCYVKRT